MGHRSDKQSWSLLWLLVLQRLVWPQLINNAIIPLKAMAVSVPLHSVMSAERLQPLRRCDSTEVGDRWVAPARASPEVSRSLSLWGSPAAGHLLPAFPSLFISGRHAIPLPVKAPPLPPPHLHPPPPLSLARLLQSLRQCWLPGPRRAESAPPRPGHVTSHFRGLP